MSSYVPNLCHCQAPRGTRPHGRLARSRSTKIICGRPSGGRFSHFDIEQTVEVSFAANGNRSPRFGPFRSTTAVFIYSSFGTHRDKRGRLPAPGFLCGHSKVLFGCNSAHGGRCASVHVSIALVGPRRSRAGGEINRMNPFEVPPKYSRRDATIQFA